jgi:hypothetical protein
VNGEVGGVAGGDRRESNPALRFEDAKAHTPGILPLDDGAPAGVILGHARSTVNFPEVLP